MLFTESVANENSEGKHHMRFAFVFFYNKVALLAEFQNSFIPIRPPFGKCNVYLQKIFIIPHEGQRKFRGEGRVSKRRPFSRESGSERVGGCLQRSFSREFE